MKLIATCHFEADGFACVDRLHEVGLDEFRLHQTSADPDQIDEWATMDRHQARRWLHCEPDYLEPAILATSVPTSLRFEREAIGLGAAALACVKLRVPFTIVAMPSPGPHGRIDIARLRDGSDDEWTRSHVAGEVAWAFAFQSGVARAARYAALSMFYDTNGDDELAERERVDEDLDTDATSERVDNVMSEAVALVEANRPGVVAVAEELLRRKVLSQASVREIVGMVMTSRLVVEKAA